MICAGIGTVVANKLTTFDFKLQVPKLEAPNINTIKIINALRSYSESKKGCRFF